MKTDYKVGSIIVYRAFGDAVRRVRVETKEADVKNGEPGFTGILLDKRSKPVKRTWDDGSKDGFERVWGYDDQILF